MMLEKMPVWGPYSKKYMGISRVVDSLPQSGARFDFSVHPTVWNSSVPVPNVTFPSNYHLWHCNGDYSYYSYRYELMWKDMIYCDVSFSKINDKAYLMRCEFFNNTPYSWPNFAAGPFMLTNFLALLPTPPAQCVPSLPRSPDRPCRCCWRGGPADWHCCIPPLPCAAGRHDGCRGAACSSCPC